MSDFEIDQPLAGIESTAEPTVLSGGVGFDLGKVEERQAEVDQILSRERISPVRRTRELNRKIKSKWDDDFGISFLDIAANELPGLQIHGVAEKLAFAANHAPGANFDSATMPAA